MLPNSVTNIAPIIILAHLVTIPNIFKAVDIAPC